MTPQQAHDFTLKRLVFGDMLLNWFLTLVLLAFPHAVDGLLGAGTSLAPAIIYRIIGLCFLGFAAWQVVMIRKGEMGQYAYIFAALMAEVPVVLLTIVLAFMGLPFKPFWRIVLWVGDGYMLLLGAWYLYLARLRAASAKAE